MKKAIIAISILAVLGGGYYYSTLDKGKTEDLIIEEFVETKVVKPSNIDSKTKLEKTLENGFNSEGKCETAGSPCMLELVRQSRAHIQMQKRLADEALAKQQKEIEEYEIKKAKMLEEIRLREEYEANRDFAAEISEYTPITNNVLYLSEAKELNLNDTSHRRFVDNYENNRFKNKDLEVYKVFKTASSDSFNKFIQKEIATNMIDGFSIPFMTSSDTYEILSLNNCRSIKSAFFCTHEVEPNIDYIKKGLDISFRPIKKGILTVQMGLGVSVEEQYLRINSKGEMLLYAPGIEKDGTLKELDQENAHWIMRD